MVNLRGPSAKRFWDGLQRLDAHLQELDILFKGGKVQLHFFNASFYLVSSQRKVLAAYVPVLKHTLPRSTHFANKQRAQRDSRFPVTARSF